MTRAYLEEMRRTFVRLHNRSSEAERSIQLNAKGFRLTKRELEVMLLVAKGKSNKEIGTSLGNSPRTVNSILTNVFKKLRVQGRGEAVHKLTTPKIAKSALIDSIGSPADVPQRT